MATMTAPRALSMTYDLVERHEPSMGRSGIVGRGRGGYHISPDVLRARGLGGDYSLKSPADRRGKRTLSSGVDYKFADGPNSAMTRVSGRMMRACTGAYDPRIEPVREWFGTLDGRRVTGYNRYSIPDFADRPVGAASSDSTHLWHLHVSIFRDCCENVDDMLGVAELICGIPLSESKTRHRTGIKPPVKPAKPKYLETYYVNPAKVSTGLSAVLHATGKVVAEVPPGFAIRNGVRTIVHNGKRWLLAESGRRYAMDYLITKQPVLSKVVDKIAPKKYLPTYVIDPDKVETFAWGVRHSTGIPTHQRPPGFRITTGVKVIQIDGKGWVLTEAGYRYALRLLKKG